MHYRKTYMMHYLTLHKEPQYLNMKTHLTDNSNNGGSCTPPQDYPTLIMTERVALVLVMVMVWSISITTPHKILILLTFKKYSTIINSAL